VCDNPSNPQLARFNDGGTDHLAASMRGHSGGRGLQRRAADAYRQRPDAEGIQCDIHGHNGLAFSHDQQWMFTSDTPNGVIYRTPLDEQGEPANEMYFVGLKRARIPDGAAMDVEGCYWSALFDGWRIARFSPQGEQLEEYRLPVRCPTMVCFGGDDMKTLFITTTRENMDEAETAKYPLSGAIFTLPVSVAGMKKSRFIER
jgi:sugar lactone lactonase YvrE